jgi:phosphate starvation-inducible PhoH-like protein
MKKKIDIQSKSFLDYSPKSTNQRKLIEHLSCRDYKIVVVTGPAGSGKTLFTCKKAIESIMSKETNKIVITRPLVTVEEELGYLPGNLIKKMDPWTKPIFDVFLEQIDKSTLEKMIIDNTIEICPLAYMRGRTFKNSYIIADEMQNSSPSQMQMLTTRLGKDSKLVINGDINQSDRSQDNGLSDLIKKVENYFIENNKEMRMIKVMDLSKEDVFRSSVVKQVLKIYNMDDSRNIDRSIEFSDFDNLYNRSAIGNNNKNSVFYKELDN